MTWRALIIEDDAASRDALETLVGAAGFEVVTAASSAAARAIIGAAPDGFDVAFVDLGLPDGDGLDLIAPLLASPSSVVVLSGERKLERAVEAMRRGASDYLVKPLDRAGLTLALNRIERELDARDERRRLRRELMAHGSYQGLVGRAPAMQALYRELERAGPTDLPIFVRGESGTGKELVARAVHQVSRRRRGPFVALNCGAIPAQLAESELFGHERGAFTGAVRPQAGAFERAHGGTLFLDELTEMPIELQVVLLRALELGVIQRVGGSKELTVDVRVVAATNRDPKEAVALGRLRHDLMFRLDVIALTLPPLRARGDDVALLSRYLLEQHAHASQTPTPALTPAALAVLRHHDWPGNVRELKNVLQRAAVMRRGEVIDASDLGLGAGVTTPEGAPTIGDEAAPTGGDVVIAKGTTLAEAERAIAIATLERLSWNRTAASAALGIAPKTLYNKLKSWGY